MRVTRSAIERRAGEKEFQSGGGGRYGCHCIRAGRAIPAATSTLTPTPTRPDPEPGLLIFPLFLFYFILFFGRSHRNKKRLFLWTPKFSVMNFRILWSTKPNSTKIHRNIYLYFPVIIELSVESYGLFKVFLPNLS